MIRDKIIHKIMRVPLFQGEVSLPLKPTLGIEPKTP